MAGNIENSKIKEKHKFPVSYFPDVSTHVPKNSYLILCSQRKGHSSLQSFFSHFPPDFFVDFSLSAADTKSVVLISLPGPTESSSSTLGSHRVGVEVGFLILTEIHPLAVVSILFYFHQSSLS